jgi:hypothetical protein
VFKLLTPNTTIKSQNIKVAVRPGSELFRNIILGRKYIDFLSSRAQMINQCQKIGITGKKNWPPLNTKRPATLAGL